MHIGFSKRGGPQFLTDQPMMNSPRMPDLRGGTGRFFLSSVAILLFVTGLLKVFSAGGTARILDQPDPLLLLNVRNVLLGSALVEIAVAVYLLVATNNALRSLFLVLWLGVSFLLYHLLLLIIHPGKPCPCLGSAAQLLSPAAATWILRFIIAYMIIGSGLFLFARLRMRVASADFRDDQLGLTGERKVVALEGEEA